LLCESLCSTVLSVLWNMLSLCTFKKVFVLFQSLRAQVANVVMAASSASASVAVDSSRSVIDLTDDDDTNTAATKPLVQMPQQVLVFAPQHPASLPSPVTSTSTAIVRPTVRPPVPQLHMAVNQQTRLQVLACNNVSVFLAGIACMQCTDAGCCFRCSMICLSVCRFLYLSVCVPCKNSRTICDTAWEEGQASVWA